MIYLINFIFKTIIIDFIAICGFNSAYFLIQNYFYVEIAPTPLRLLCRNILFN